MLQQLKISHKWNIFCFTIKLSKYCRKIHLHLRNLLLVSFQHLHNSLEFYLAFVIKFSGYDEKEKIGRNFG